MRINFSVLDVALRGILSTDWAIQLNVPVALREEEQREEEGSAVSLKLLDLSPKVRGVDSEYLHQGNAERKEYLKVRTPIDF